MTPPPRRSPPPPAARHPPHPLPLLSRSLRSRSAAGGKGRVYVLLGGGGFSGHAAYGG
jgi:hypothetical protein